MARGLVPLVSLGACLVLARGLARDDEGAHPVSKVITLLKDMNQQLQKEGEGDEEVYSQMTCWCETNDKEKTKAIKENGQAVEVLSASIEELTGKSARLNEEISTLRAEVAKDEQALSSASALRTKQLAEFKAEESSMLGSISSLKSAVATLEKQQSAAGFLQSPDTRAVAETLRTEMRRHKDLIGGILTIRETKFLQSFAQKPDGFFDAEPTLRQAQAPPSSELFGILKQMRESFETNLASSQKEETEAHRAFEDMKAAKTTQISAGSTSMQQKLEELADADEKNARSKVERENAQDCLEADTKFLTDLKEKCAAFDQQYEERTKTRQAEMEAVTKALEFLTSDEASDLFARNFSPSLVQRTALGDRRAAVAARLVRAAVQAHDPRLSTIAARVRIDSFGRVKKTLNDMVDRLVKEKDEEVAQKEQCVDGFNKNDKATAESDQTKLQLVAKIEDLQMAQDTLTKEIDTLKAEIAEMQKQMKYAGDNREMENHDFNLAIADQVATQKLLNGALNVLKGFYEKKAALVQSSMARGKVAGRQPAGFKPYAKSEAGAGVMEMIKSVINESKMALQEAQFAESDAQTAYEEFVKNSNVAIEEKTRDVVNKIEVKGKVEAEKVEKSVQRDETLDELQQLADELHALHISCDYIMKNWEVRTTARDEEVEALKEAIGMFSGASFSDFLQKLG